MKKVSIKKQGIETHGAQMEDPTAWIAQEVANNSWGLPDRWLPDSPLNPLSDEEKAKATETRVIQNDLGEDVTEYFFPAEYTIEIEDITAQVETEKAQIEAIKNAQVQAGLRLQAFPAQIDSCQDLSELKLAIKQMVQDIAVLLR